MSDTVDLQTRIQQLKKANAEFPKVLYRAAKTATMRAIEAAKEATPPKEWTGRGPYIGKNTVTGALKAHWSTDSTIEPRGSETRYETILANDMEYASYVNDGHRMDRHFVPGLYIDPESGLLSYDPNKKAGIVVGTKTKYVKGEFMVDKAKKAYQKSLLSELDEEIERLLK